MWWRLCLVAVVILLSGAIALKARYSVHPDEVAHTHGFLCFEKHWWTPDVNSDDMVYSPQGWSRVHTGELVYSVPGLPGGFVRQALQHKGLPGSGKLSLYTYRFANVNLFAITLASLLLVRSKTIAPFVVSSKPQLGTGARQHEFPDDSGCQGGGGHERQRPPVAGAPAGSPSPNRGERKGA